MCHISRFLPLSDRCWLLLILLPLPIFFFFLQTAHQPVQVPEGTDSECIECTLLPEKRTLELQRLCSEHSGGPADTQEPCHQAVLGRGCWTSCFGL